MKNYFDCWIVRFISSWNHSSCHCGWRISIYKKGGGFLYLWKNNLQLLHHTKWHCTGISTNMMKLWVGFLSVQSQMNHWCFFEECMFNDFCNLLILNHHQVEASDTERENWKWILSVNEPTQFYQWGCWCTGICGLYKEVMLSCLKLS